MNLNPLIDGVRGGPQVTPEPERQPIQELSVDTDIEALRASLENDPAVLAAREARARAVAEGDTGDRVDTSSVNTSSASAITGIQEPTGKRKHQDQQL